MAPAAWLAAGLVTKRYAIAVTCFVGARSAIDATRVA
jgi:hypothetical protein